MNLFLNRRQLIFPTGLLIFLIGGISSCSLLDVAKSRIPSPEFSIQNIRIKEVSLSEITLELVSSVKNPYNTSLPTSKLGMDLFLEGRKFSHIDTDLGAIQARSTKSLPLDLKFKYTDLISFYRLAPGKEALDLKLKGDLKLPIPANQQALLGMKEISFPIEINRPLPNLNPDLEISNFTVDMPDLSTLAIDAARSTLGGILGGSRNQEPPSLITSFDLAFKNKNPAPMLLSNLKFDMNLDGNNFLNLSPREITREGNSNLIKVKTQVPILDAGSALVKSLQKKEARYEIKGLSGIQFPGIDSETASFNYSKLGNLRWK